VASYRLHTTPEFNGFLQDLPPAAQDEVLRLLELIEQDGDIGDRVGTWRFPTRTVFVLQGNRAWVTFDVVGQDVYLVACARMQTWSPNM
jgi:hypothetical protein